MINNLDKLSGGVGDNTPTTEVDPIQLSTGIQIEMENTNDTEILFADLIKQNLEFFIFSNILCIQLKYISKQ